METEEIYPTDGKVRRKQLEQEAKEKGTALAVRKKAKKNDQHYDDCGDSLVGLGKDTPEFTGFEGISDEVDENEYDFIAS